MGRYVNVSVKIPEIYLIEIDRLVNMGRYMNRSEVIRIAVRNLLDRELGNVRQSMKKSSVVVK